MPKKSLVQRSQVDEAQKAHNCQSNSRHRLAKGERRLKVHVDRSYDHYCKPCALRIIEQDIARLQTLARQLTGELPLEPAAAKRPKYSASI